MFCLEVRFEREEFVNSCSHQIWGFIAVVPILFSMFGIFLFKICIFSLLHVFYWWSRVFLYLWAKPSCLRDLFYLLCGCKTLISIFAFRKTCVLFLLWHWSSCGTFPFMLSPNNAHMHPMCFPSILPAPYWALLSHAPVLEAHKVD